MGRAGMVWNAITAVGAPGLARVRGTARIEVLDMLRGIALLGILFINMPYMAAPVAQFSADVRAIGWTLPDRIAWSVNYLVWSGTMRCVLQFLFGAGMMILTARAMEPDGPVAVADLYRSEEHTSELQSLMRISYAVFCLKKKTTKQTYNN